MPQQLRGIQKLDPDHTFESLAGVQPPPESVAFSAYNQSVNDDDRLPPVSDKLSQKALSQGVDRRTLAQLRHDAGQSRRDHLDLVCKGSGSHWHAAPSKTAGLYTEPSLFVATLRRWLRIRFSDADVECPLCDGVLDGYGDHALVCCGGGDRTRRHNLLRNMVYHAAEAANHRPELEKPGLLPQRPLLGSTYENGSALNQHDSRPGARRPADVYIPRWRLGPPAAWDFAVTSGLRLGLHADAASPDGITSRYEDLKSSHQDTRAECLAQGITFIPMVVEAVGGGWGKMARCVWSELAKNSALATGELETESTCAIMLQQRLSMVLHRENARACLRRF